MRIEKRGQANLSKRFNQLHRFRPGLEPLEERAVPATFYVATTGSNSNSGDSNNPWQTLHFAAGRVGPGDTVIVRPGTYVGFDLRTDGTASQRITFSAEPGVTINTRNPVTNDGINLEGANYVTIEGFNVVGIGRTGIRTVSNTGVIIRNNNCDLNVNWGILTGVSENILIENNVTTRSVNEHGIYVSNSGDNPIVRGNTIWGNRGNGLHMNGDLSAGGGDGLISNALVENNKIYDNGLGGGSAINCDGVRNSVFRNNLVYNTHASGISLYKINAGGPSTGNLVVNNTILASSTGRWALNVQTASTGNTFLNNIFYSAQSFRGAISLSADSLPGTVSDYNILEDRFTLNDDATVLNLSQWRQATNQDAHSFITTNPNSLFVNAGSGDYHLAAGSAAIDAGTSTNAPTTDFYANPRPSGTGFDIGHSEFFLAAPTVESVAVNAGASQRSRVTHIAVTFSMAVNTTPLATAFGLARTGGGSVGTINVATALVNGKTVATLTFSGANTEFGSLADGRWTLTIDRTKVQSSGSGAQMAVNYSQANINRLFGDINGDAVNDTSDLDTFGLAYGNGSGGPSFLAGLDWNSDGVTDVADLDAFGTRYGSGV